MAICVWCVCVCDVIFIFNTNLPILCTLCHCGLHKGCNLQRKAANPGNGNRLIQLLTVERSEVLKGVGVGTVIVCGI